jgi:hypothetical protein
MKYNILINVFIKYKNNINIGLYEQQLDNRYI